MAYIGKTNWQNNEIVEAADMNRIEQGILDAIDEVNNNTVDIGNVEQQVNAHQADETNPHNVTKEQVGLSSVDNTSDANKPISTATQTALNGKANTTGTYGIRATGTLKGDVDLGNVANYGIASQAEAQAGTSNTKYMTPLRVKEAISGALSSSSKITTGTYSGNSSDISDKTLRTITVGFEPKFVHITNSARDVPCILSPSFLYKVGGNSSNDRINTNYLTSTGFIVMNKINDNLFPVLNNSDRTYDWVAFG